MTPYLRSHRRLMVIHRLSDWEIWYLMRNMPDQELVNFSSACHRFRIIATTLLTYRAERKPYTDIVFKSQSGCCTERFGPNGKPRWWLHPIQIISSIKQSPQLATHIKNIDTVILRNDHVDFDSRCMSCHGNSIVEQLQASSDMTALVSRLGFLSPQRQSAWIRAINMLDFTATILLLILLCPNLELLTIRDAGLDKNFNQWIKDISPAMLPTPGVNNLGQTIPLSMPPIETINFIDHSPVSLPTVDFHTILQFSHIHGLRALNCSNVTGIQIRQPFWPSPRLSTLEHVKFMESSILVLNMLYLIRNLPELKELTYSERGWFYSTQLVMHAVTSPSQYQKSLRNNGHDLLQDRKLKVSRVEWTENLRPSDGNGPEPGPDNTITRRAIKVVPKYKR